MLPEASESKRLANVSSIVGTVARYVDDLIPLGSGNPPAWLAEVGAPVGWRIAHLADRTFEPARIAVSGQHRGGGWDGCETIGVYRFTGVPPEDVVRRNADRTLRDLDATEIAAQSVDVSQLPQAVAVRSSGYFAAAGLWMWAQYSIYVFGSPRAGQSELIEQALFVESNCRERMQGDITQLTFGVYRATSEAHAGTHGSF